MTMTVGLCIDQPHMHTEHSSEAGGCMPSNRVFMDDCLLADLQPPNEESDSIDDDQSQLK